MTVPTDDDVEAAMSGGEGLLAEQIEYYRAVAATIERRLRDGTAHRLVKVPHTTERLEHELATLGWDISVHPTAGPFYWGAGARAIR